MHDAGVRGFLQVVIRAVEDFGRCGDGTHSRLSVSNLKGTLSSNVLKVRILCRSLPYQDRFKLAKAEGRLHHVPSRPVWQ